MRRDGAVDGFRLAYERTGSGQETAVLLLQGWPGDRTDSRSRRPDRRPTTVLWPSHDPLFPAQ